MALVLQLLDLVRHMGDHLERAAGQLGGWMYVLLFVIIFCETGLVVTPFLPGDSLLFAVGALAVRPGVNLSPTLLIVSLFIAAVLGDAVNYAIGKFVGPKVFHSDTGRLLNKKHLLRAQAFYERYGGKAIFLARFVPIVRTFAPFVAGIGKMQYRRFWFYNTIGGAVWVTACILAGVWFGEIEFVKKNFEAVIVGIIVVSVLPIVIEWYLERRRTATAATVASAPTDS